MQMITAKEAKDMAEAHQIEIIKEKLKSNEKLLATIENRIKNAANINGRKSTYFYFTGEYYPTIEDMEFIEYYLATYCGFKTKLYKDARYLEISWE